MSIEFKRFVKWNKAEQKEMNADERTNALDLFNAVYCRRHVTHARFDCSLPPPPSLYFMSRPSTAILIVHGLKLWDRELPVGKMFDFDN